ncbi:MAG: SdpI family protein [Chloroflexi bacterium]|nr:SdpI family protein [Chloroflexota bacterium]
MLGYALLVGGILFAAGIATYVFAPIVGPNPIFGVRIGYAYASRETWDKTNRFGGALMALVGTGILILGLLMQTMNFAARDGITIMTVIMLVTLGAALVWMYLYARNLAQATPIARELVSVRFHWYYLAPVLATFALLVASMLVIYPTLPADRVPSHFNFYDQADGWQTRNEFLLTFLGMAFLFVALNAFIVLVATREPLIAFSRWGSGWRLDPEKGLVFVGVVFAIVNLIFIALLWNIGWFTAQGALAFSFSVILWMLIPLIGFIIALFFVLGRREP